MPGSQESIAPVASPAVQVEPQIIIHEQPSTTPRGRLGAMRVACCPDTVNVACDRLSKDPFAINAGFCTGYAMGILSTAAGAACGVFITPPLFIMGAIPCALTSTLAATHIGCCMHHYCQTVEDLQNATGPTTDETYLVVPDDIAGIVANLGIEPQDRADGGVVTTEPAKKDSPKDPRYDEAYEIARLLRDNPVVKEEISTTDMPGDREGLIIDHDPSAAKKTSFSTHNDYLVIEHS